MLVQKTKELYFRDLGDAIFCQDRYARTIDLPLNKASRFHDPPLNDFLLQEYYFIVMFPKN